MGILVSVCLVSPLGRVGKFEKSLRERERVGMTSSVSDWNDVLRGKCVWNCVMVMGCGG